MFFHVFSWFDYVLKSLKLILFGCFEIKKVLIFRGRKYGGGSCVPESPFLLYFRAYIDIHYTRGFQTGFCDPLLGRKEISGGPRSS